MYSFPENIFSLVRTERDDFLYNYIEIVPGYQFNQYQNVKKIHLYYNSHFVDGDYEDVNGVLKKKLFHNINKWRCDVASKMIDLDVKDMILVSDNPQSDLTTDILEKELKVWLKRNKAGKILNEISRKLPVYGSCLLRKTKDGAELIDLRNLFIEQGASSAKNAQYVIIKHLMSPGDLRKMRKVWDGVDEVIEKYCNYAPKSYEADGNINVPVGIGYAEVYERYGEVPLSWFTGLESDENEFVEGHFIISGCDDQLTNEGGQPIGENGVILFQEQLDSRPFAEVHYNRTEGRWQGLGVVEDTFEAQRRKNEIENQRAKGMEISTLIAFTTPDSLVQRNILSDVDTGEILKTQNPLQRIPTQELNMAAYNSASQEVENLADRLTFSYDVIRGEQTMASSTAFAVNTQVQQASSIFEYKRENMELFLNEFISDQVFPQLEKEMKKAHPFRYTGSVEEVNKLRDTLINVSLRSKILDFIIENGYVPTEEEIQTVKDKITLDMRKRDGNKVWVQIVDKFFEDIDYNVDIIITGENRNIFTQLQNAQNILAMIVRYPGALENPVVRTFIFQMMRDIGMNPTEIEMVEQKQNEMNSAQQQIQPQPNELPTAQPGTTQ